MVSSNFRMVEFLEHFFPAGVPHEEHPKLAWEGVEGVVFHADEDRYYSK